MNNKSLVILLLIGIIIGSIGYWAYAQVNQWIDNTNTGIILPSVLFIAEINDVEVSNSTNNDWAILMYGDNTKTLNVTNVSAGLIRVYLYVSDLPVGWIVSWTPNGTLLDAGASFIASYIVNIPEGYLEGSYGWNHTLYAVQA